MKKVGCNLLSNRWYAHGNALPYHPHLSCNLLSNRWYAHVKSTLDKRIFAVVISFQIDGMHTLINNTGVPDAVVISFQIDGMHTQL